jgi:hypothetical protein
MFYCFVLPLLYVGCLAVDNILSSPSLELLFSTDEGKKGLEFVRTILLSLGLCCCLCLWPDPMKHILHDSVYGYNLCMLIYSHLPIVDFILELKVCHILGLTLLLWFQPNVFQKVNTYVKNYPATHLRNS